jgi:putative FmdB family regulatory protein
MPIYVYRCEACGFAKDVLQKISDAPLTQCPSCSKSTFKKQLTAAGFQLKGSGWYVTDFRSGSGGAAKPANGGEPATAATGTSDASASSASAEPSGASSASGASGASGTPAAAASTTAAPGK